jgi:hypothetical protein
MHLKHNWSSKRVPGAVSSTFDSVWKHYVGELLSQQVYSTRKRYHHCALDLYSSYVPQQFMVRHVHVAQFQCPRQIRLQEDPESQPMQWNISTCVRTSRRPLITTISRSERLG